ncbi:ANTAR domain-containing protein [Amycolatopsis coloradensis]|uniref:ANTAR domain-containing protein n=1 Tax=Amycolatopsis coloradensis TaxID=76021 RepID=A0A1R0KDS0_9PSEU|nr:ANTAR domain-containing protein [Amycolatopsis coloradensis]OLZ43139.1 ANTAR domain-containing protein [Amycolatopsis coloradensis]
MIKQADGMSMVSRGRSAEQAFLALKAISQHTNVTLRDVATVIVAGGSHTEPSLPDREVARVVLAETRRSVLGSSFGE